MRDVFAREPANRLAAQAESNVGKRPAGEIHDRSGQRFIEWREGPSEAVHSAPLAQGAVECLAQRERAVLSCVVIVDLQIALAGERQVEARVAAERIEEMVEEADAGLHGGLPGAVEIERYANRCFARGSGHSRSPRGGAHGSHSSRAAT